MKYNFEELYSRVLNTLQEIEKQRIALIQKKLKQTVIISLILSMVIIAYLCFWEKQLILNLNSGFMTLILSGSVLLVGVCCFSFKCAGRVKLSDAYKNDIVNKMIVNILPSAEYHKDRGIDCNYFKNSLLTTENPDRYLSEDLVTGKIEETVFSFGEIHAEKRYYTDKGHERWEDIFKGIFFIADFHKDFSGKTLVGRDSFIKFTSHSNMHRVKLEDPVFEKIFDVYGTDQVEARYVLTPSIMERLVQLNHKISSKITLSFENSMVNIAIPQNKNNFEVPLFSTVLNKKRIEKEFILLINLIEIVEDLNLNTRIWSKS